MGEPLIKESFPGSGVTKAGTRINLNMKDYSKSPCLIRKMEKAKAAAEDPGLQFLYQLCMKKKAAQMKRSLFRRICFSLNEDVKKTFSFN